MESDHQEQSCLKLIAELKLAQDGVFKIHVAFKCTCTLIRKSSQLFFLQPTLFMLKHNDIQCNNMKYRYKM